MKKVLVIISNFNGVGGAETATYRFLSQIDRAKFHIDVCFFGFEDDFVLAFKSFVNNAFCIDVKKRGHLSSYFELLKLIKKENYGIIHTHLALADLYGLFLSLVTPARWISTEHNLSDRRKVTVLGRMYYRLARRKVHCFIGVSSKITEWLKTMGAHEEKLVLIPNPIELAKSNPGGLEKGYFLRSHGWPEDSVVLGTVANLRLVKGLNHLIDGIRILIEDGLNVRLVIAGEGPERGNLEDQIMKCGLSEHVILLGYQKHIDNLLSLLDMYVSASLMEGFGISIVEAMSYAVPVVSTEVGGVTDFLEHMKNSYLVRPRDPHALAEGISYLVSHKAEAIKLGQQAFYDIKKFETGSLVQYLEGLYLGDAHRFETG